MKRLTLFVLALLAISVSSALAQDVRYNFDKNADFSKFKTYRWVTIKGAEPVDNLMDQQIKSAIDAELATKGLTKVDSDPADLYIGYQGAIRTEREFNSYSTGWGAGPGWGGGWYGAAGSSTVHGTTNTIYVGQLVLDMYETQNKGLVWRGLMSKTIDPKAKPEKQQKNLKKAVTKLLKHYPPKQT